MIKIYYVLCGTKGKIGWSYMKDVDVKNKHAICCRANGVENGRNNLEHSFLTPEQALNDWKRRSDSETTEHVDAVQKAGEALIEQAEKLRKKVRQLGPWQDL